MNTASMSFTPKAIQDLLDELEASKQSRLRAWNVLQRLRMVLSEMGSVAIPPTAQKTFDAEGEALEADRRATCAAFAFLPKPGGNGGSIFRTYTLGR